MSDHIQKTLADIRGQVEAAESKVIDLKKMANQLAQLAGLSVVYNDAELKPASSATGSLRPDRFYGKPLATCVTQILEMRNSTDAGPATIREIYESLVEGGHQFGTDDPKNAQRGLRISITKNSKFHKLPGGQIGLTEWYPDVKTSKQPTNSNNETDESEIADEQGGSDGDFEANDGGDRSDA